MNPPLGRGLYTPRPVTVEGERGRPLAVRGAAVEAIREEWLIEDRWWTPGRLRRHYFELVLADGRLITIFHDLESGGWYCQ